MVAVAGLGPGVPRVPRVGQARWDASPMSEIYSLLRRRNYSERPASESGQNYTCGGDARNSRRSGRLVRLKMKNGKTRPPNEAAYTCGGGVRKLANARSQSTSGLRSPALA